MVRRNRSGGGYHPRRPMVTRNWVCLEVHMRGGDDRRRGRSGGFSLVEALVALIVFGVGAIALVQLAPRARQFATRGHQVSEASNLAQSKLEELRALPREHAELQAGLHIDTANPLAGNFDRRWLVSADDPVAGMRRVEVRVRFPTLSADSVAALSTYF